MNREIDFVVGNSGITIYCTRLNTPRYLPFDIKAKCEKCNSENVRVDYAVTKEGIYVQCSRITDEKFVAFDQIENFDKNCIFRVKMRGKVFNIPFTPEKTILENILLPPPPPPPQSPTNSIEPNTLENIKKE